MIHYVYVGHFARQGDFIAFQKQTDGSMRPVVTCPLSMETIQQVLQRNGGNAPPSLEEWGLWLDHGFIVCDRFTHRREAIDVVRHLATETGCDIADYSSQSLVLPSELSFAWEPHVQSAKAHLPTNRGEVVAVAAPSSD